MLKPFVIHLQLQHKGEVITDRRVRLDEAEAHRLYDTLESVLLEAPEVPVEPEDETLIVADPEPVYCPACDGEGVPLGQLGTRLHFRCRQCGIDFSNLA